MGGGGGVSLRLPGWGGPGDTGSAPLCRVEGVSQEWLWSWHVSEGLPWLFLSCCFPGSGRFCTLCPDQKPKPSSSSCWKGKAEEPLPVEQPFLPPCCQHWGLTCQLPFAAVILCVFLRSGVLFLLAGWLLAARVLFRSCLGVTAQVCSSCLGTGRGICLLHV